jgi:foldase protein PrsA
MTEENKNTHTHEEKVETKKKFSLKINYKVLGIILGIGAFGALMFFAKGYVIAGVVNGKLISRSKVVSELERRSGQQILEGLINQALIDQEARKRGITVTQQELDEDVKKIEANMQSQGSTLETALAQQNLNREQFMAILLTNKKLEKLIADKVKISDKEVEDYLAANKDSFPKESDQAKLKEQIRTFLEQQKVDSESQNLFNQLRAAAKIQYWAKF